MYKCIQSKSGCIKPLDCINFTTQSDFGLYKFIHCINLYTPKSDCINLYTHFSDPDYLNLYNMCIIIKAMCGTLPFQTFVVKENESGFEAAVEIRFKH